MKNTIPLILAVLLGLVAVFAVSRLVAKNRGREVDMVQVLIANKSLSAGTQVRADDLGVRSIPSEAYMGHQHVLAELRNQVVGQKLVRGIDENSFVLFNYFRDPNLGDGLLGVNEGEWGVPVHFADATLVPSLDVNDEIAIVMVAQDFVPSGKKDEEGRDILDRVQTARVLFPMVRVLRKTQDGILVSLDPKEAQRLLMAQLNAPLYPMLRNRGDFAHRSVQSGAGVTNRDLEEKSLVNRDKASAAR